MNGSIRRVGSFVRPKVIVGLAVLVAIVILGHQFQVAERLAEALDRIQSMGPFGPIVFILIYIAAAVAFIPGSILTLGAGAVFGVLWGTIYVSIAATLGATAAFLIGRYLARDWVSARIAGYPRFKAFDKAVGREGWKIVGLVRLSPIFPFNLLNYAFGLTAVRLRDYFWASWLGMLPGTLMYVYLGSLGGDLARASAGTGGRSEAQWAVYALGLAATIAVTVYIARIASRILKEKT